MRISMLMCKQTQPLLSISPGGLTMDVSGPRWPKERVVVVVMGATGTGKSRLSIDLATRFPAEIVNSDKMQVYEGLDIVTNKITEEEERGVPHHLLGIAHPNADFTASNFRDMASLSIESILGRGHLPIIVGGFNSYIEALVGVEYCKFRSRYECCFLWVDVSPPVLHSSVSVQLLNFIHHSILAHLVDPFGYGRVEDRRGDIHPEEATLVAGPELAVFVANQGLNVWF